MGVRFLVANGFVLGSIVWMTTVAGMEVRASEVVPSHPIAGGVDLAQLETRAALAPASISSVAALAGGNTKKLVGL